MAVHPCTARQCPPQNRVLGQAQASRHAASRGRQHWNAVNRVQTCANLAASGARSEAIPIPAQASHAQDAPVTTPRHAHRQRATDERKE